jgi:glucosamine 6-phosphate synthetase-like amidotransferase/phosphosugar isomerase protein
MHGIAEEVKNLGGASLLVADDKSLGAHVDIVIDHVPESISPVLFAVPLELLAYNFAVQRGLDINSYNFMSKVTKVE